MNKIIGILSLRGGSGKSTLAKNLSAGLAIRGKKVLLMDSGPIWGGILELIPEDTKVEYDIVSVYEGIPLKKTIYHSTIQGVDIVPFIPEKLDSLLNYSNIISQQFNNKNPLKKALNPEAIRDYDYVIIDAFPLLDTKIGNFLQVTNRLIVPVSDYTAMNNLKEIDEIILTIIKMKLELCIDTIVMTKVISNAALFRKIREELEEVFGDKVCKTSLPYSIAFADASMYDKSIYDYAPQSSAAVRCMKLVDELLKKWGGDA